MVSRWALTCCCKLKKWRHHKFWQKRTVHVHISGSAFPLLAAGCRCIYTENNGGVGCNRSLFESTFRLDPRSRMNCQYQNLNQHGEEMHWKIQNLQLYDNWVGLNSISWQIMWYDQKLQISHWMDLVVSLLTVISKIKKELSVLQFLVRIFCIH